MIRLVSRGDYDIRGLARGGKLTEIAWYATADNKVIGVVVEDRKDNLFNWMVLTENDQGPGYTSIDIGTSLASEDEATLLLHAAMVSATA